MFGSLELIVYFIFGVNRLFILLIITKYPILSKYSSVYCNKSFNMLGLMNIVLNLMN